MNSPTPQKLISWNVNGIRAVLQKGFIDFVHREQPDVICLQETKAKGDEFELNLDGFEKIFNAAEKRGYSGTAILTRQPPISVVFGLGDNVDPEGRVITAEYEKFYLVNVYTPNAKRDLSRLPYRQSTWDPGFLDYLQKLEKTKPVVFCGDLNVAHTEIDLANPKTNRRNAGFTDEERTGFGRYIEAGFIDTFRMFETGGGHYTWWTWRNNARARNIGWRIDYFCVSGVMRTRVKQAKILCDVHGSDHCPVSLEITD